jgi:heterodisulfide reductase subunit A
MNSKLGVYICHCGANIGSVVDSKAVAEYISKLRGVKISRDFMYMCSDRGQNLIRDDIKNLKLDGVVVASCSPRMHEPTFRRVCTESGLNKYLFEMANLREHCSWVHSHEKASATEKAKLLVKMAVERAKRLDSIPSTIIPIKKEALVIGGGISGLTSATNLVKAGFKVRLIEKKPYLGGNVLKLGKTFPFGIEGPEILEPIQAILPKYIKNGLLEIYLGAEIESVSGYFGNYQIKISTAKYIKEECDLCGKCIEVCPVKVQDELSYRKAIYSIPKSFPKKMFIDKKNCNLCGKCESICPKNAIDLSAKKTINTLDAGTIIIATGFEDYIPKNEYGYGQSKDVITLRLFHRMISKYGLNKIFVPSTGKKPKTVIFISCVGSRQETGHEYCSRVCCSAIMECAKYVKKYVENVIILYRDLRTVARYQEESYRTCRDIGITFIKYSLDAPPKVSTKEGRLKIDVLDKLSGLQLEINGDLVVLATAMVAPKDTEKISSLFHVSRSSDNFFLELHPKLNPLLTPTEGIFIAGVAQSPKDITDSVAQASGAAIKAAIPMAKGEVEIESITGEVNALNCSACGICKEICPYGAIELKETMVGRMKKISAQIVTAMCKGCGACSAACFSGCISMKHFKDDQLLGMINACLR